MLLEAGWRLKPRRTTGLVAPSADLGKNTGKAQSCIGEQGQVGTSPA